MHNHKALALISGGLDSLLATKAILEQGIKTEAIHFFTGFFGENPINPDWDKLYSARWIANQLNINLMIVNAIDKFQSVLLNPAHGYGCALNPCLDCKIFMVREALIYAECHGFDFVISGEVIGQRPMSQRKDTMPVVAKESGAFDRLLRPLCAKLLPPTLPERESWVNRELLFDFSGRSRKPQLELAKKYGFKAIPQAGGGCILTEKKFATRLKDYWHTHGKRVLFSEEIELLKLGRHLRLSEDIKLIIGRDEAENIKLKKYLSQHVFLYAIDYNGALGLIELTNPERLPSEEIINLGARILARFSQGRAEKEVRICINFPSGQVIYKAISPLPEEEILESWYL